MKKLLYSTMIACLALAGFDSCKPQDSDDHSLGGSVIPQEALSLGVSQVDEPKQTTFTLTNNSQQLDGVTYYISTNGTKVTAFPIGASTEITVKANGPVSATLYAFSGCDQKMFVWTKDVDWINTEVGGDDKQWLGYTEGTDLLADWKPDNNFWFSPSDWSGGLNPGIDGDIHSGLSFTIPEGTGSDQWQAQIHIEHNGPKLSAGKTYDFSIAIESSADMEGDGVTVKPQLEGDDNTFFSDARHKITRGINVISLADCAGFDGVFKLALDFAGAPVGTEITIKRVFLTEHNAANVTGDTWAFDYSSDKNILKDQPFGSDFRFWFADGGWSQVADPDYEGDSSAELTLTMPEGIGPDQWQGQVHIPFDNVKLSAGKTYDLSLVVVANGDVPGMTVKAQNDADDNVFLTADRHDVSANVPTAITLVDLPGFDGKFRMCLDFGGTAAGTTVKILGMYVAEHK